MRDMWRLAASSGQVSGLDGRDDGLFWVMDPAATRVADMVTEELGVADACRCLRCAGRRPSNGCGRTRSRCRRLREVAD